MKRVIFLAFTLLLTASLVVAQDTQTSAGDSSSVSGDFNLRTFRGCLSQVGNQYALTVAGASPRQYRLLGSNLAQLDGKTGHMVSITGTLPESLPVGGGVSATSGSDTINFLAVEDLASSCAASSDRGPAAETPYSRADASIISEGTQSIPSSYMIVPLVGVLALGLLQIARFRSRK